MTGRANPLALRGDARGLRLEALGLWLDPVEPPPPKDIAFLSHAHAKAPGSIAPSDRRGPTENAPPPPSAEREGVSWLASPETLALLDVATTDREPGGPTPTRLAGGRPLAWNASMRLPIRDAFGGGEARLSLVPAGHVLGAAQLIVDHPWGRFVYTGDFSPEDDPTRPAAKTIPCDELVITTTYALPIFRFEPLARPLDALVDWCVAQRTRRITPVVLVQSPGPAQRVARALLERGVPVVATEPIRRACRAYESLGVPVGEVGAPGADPSNNAGAAVLAPPSARVAELRGRGFGLARAAVAYASGWACLDAAVAQKRADAAFVLADQADFDRCLALVAGSGASRVYPARGHTRALAHEIARLGIDAHAIEGAAIDDRASS